MKKVLKIIIIIVAAIIVVGVVVPLIFSGTIEKIVKSEIEKSDNLKVDYEGFSLSILSSFPDLRINLFDVSVVGKTEFCGDTLLQAKHFAVDVDFASGISGDLKITTIILDNPIVNVTVCDSGVVNCSHVTFPGEFRETLKQVIIRNANVSISEPREEMKFSVVDLDLAVVHGEDFSFEATGIQLVKYGINIVGNSSVRMEARTQYNSEQRKVEIGENELFINGMPIGFNGWFQLVDSAIVIDFQFAADDPSLKTFLALSPSFIPNDTKAETIGMTTLYARIQGEYIKGVSVPKLDFSFKVGNGRVQYPKLYNALSSIEIDFAAHNAYGIADSLKIDLRKLHFILEGEPFDATFYIEKPESNMAISGDINGKIDLAALTAAVPFEGIEMGGIVSSNLKFAWNKQMIENADYQSITADGTVTLKDYSYVGTDIFRHVKINEGKFVFTPRDLYILVNGLQLGTSGLDIEGKIESYLPHYLIGMQARGVITTHNLLVRDSKFQEQLVRMLNNEKYAELRIDESTYVIEFEENKITVPEFELPMFGMHTKFSGWQSKVDDMMHYEMRIPVPRRDISGLLGAIGIPIEGDDLPIDVEISGRMGNPQLTINLDAARNVVKNDFKH